MNEESKKFNGVKLKPLYDHVVVKPLENDEITKSGIVLPGTVSKEKPEQGEIIAVGNGKLSDSGQIIPLIVKVGDKVVFKKYSADEIKIGSDEYLVIRESDIMAILI